MRNLRLCPYNVDGGGIRALKRILAKRIDVKATSVEHMHMDRKACVTSRVTAVTHSFIHSFITFLT